MVWLWIVIPLVVYLIGAIVTFFQIGEDAEGMDHASFAGIWFIMLLLFKIAGAVFWPLVAVTKVYGIFKSDDR